jgi:hypothetical protein
LARMGENLANTGNSGSVGAIQLPRSEVTTRMRADAKESALDIIAMMNGDKAIPWMIEQSTIPSRNQYQKQKHGNYKNKGAQPQKHSQRRLCSGQRRLRRNQRRSLAFSFFPRSLKRCLMSLLNLSQREIVLAFSRAATESKFFPAPATLREFSGRAATGDSIAAEAKAELLYLLITARAQGGRHPWPVALRHRESPLSDSAGKSALPNSSRFHFPDPQGCH